ncbi:MAG TPA: APC family permease [Bryobacteraceae bacterium]|jgi:amino acid transporter|nr:APC family permease [Bryobacteraceae bacterium]
MAEQHGLKRGLGLLEATALNMSNMVGVGPFVTIPLLIGAMGGPQCMLGWAVGAVLSLSDGLVWSELAAAMPGEGGSFLYLREAFRFTRLSTLLPFLFIWQFMVSAPLEIATGYIGFAQYVSYFRRGMTAWEGRLAVLVVGVLVVALLYRGIQSVGRMTVVLWIGMLATVIWIVAAGFAHFDPHRAFDFPPHAFAISPAFMAGLGSATLIAMYNYLGYYGICFVGGEVRQPERTMPRSIVLSVLLVAAMYALMTLAIMAVVPWREAAQSKFVAARFMEMLYGPWAGRAVTVLILWSAVASVFALLLAYSRVPYAAALDGYFWKPFARLHPKGDFPYVSLLVIGGLAIAGGMLSLDWVVSATLTARVLIQFIGQIAAVEILRRSRPDIRRPFRMWLYPLPSVLALIGWIYVFATSGWPFVLGGLGMLASGAAAFAVWRRTAN